MTENRRCAWCGDDPLYQQYHDREWGVPCRDDQTLFEFVVLEGAQAGQLGRLQAPQTQIAFGHRGRARPTRGRGTADRADHPRTRHNVYSRSLFALN